MVARVPTCISCGAIVPPDSADDQLREHIETCRLIGCVVIPEPQFTCSVQCSMRMLGCLTAAVVEALRA